MKILPAIDILDGSCVRLLKGDFNHVTKYDSNPIKQAKKFIENGFDYLHIIDLNAASTNSLDNLEIIQDIAKLSNLKIQVGGGIRSIQRIKNLISLGVDRVIVGTAAIENNQFLLKLKEAEFVDKVIFALDFKLINSIPILATHGWAVDSKISLFDFLESNKWIHNVLATDISLDGTLQGPNIDIYKQILKNRNINLIASGGIGSIYDVLTMKKLGANECIVGKAIYENKISLKELLNVNK